VCLLNSTPDQQLQEQFPLQHHASEADAAACKEAGVYENLIASCMSSVLLQYKTLIALHKALILR
jgi:hypothetical protein